MVQFTDIEGKNFYGVLDSSYRNNNGKQQQDLQDRFETLKSIQGYQSCQGFWILQGSTVETGGGGGYGNQHQDQDPQLKGRNGSATNYQTEEFQTPGLTALNIF